jgi:4-hydroxybenzoate polyprenyltransferase
MLFGALFAMHSHVFGEIMDFGPDRTSGRRTTATVIGVVPAKLLISGMLVCEALLVFKHYGNIWISGALAFATLWFLLDGLLIWRNQPYSLKTMRVFMFCWNAFALGSMGWVWSTAPFSH